MYELIVITENQPRYIKIYSNMEYNSVRQNQIDEELLNENLVRDQSDMEESESYQKHNVPK